MQSSHRMGYRGLNKMIALPPGTLLQLMYLRERIDKIPPGEFIEIGPGSGEITRLLLELGWSGFSYDLEEKTITALQERFSKEIEQQRLTPINADFITANLDKKVDLVISCMVMEHLDNDAQNDFMNSAENHLKSDGIMITLVPSSPAHWGIEDDIAGHYRRYTQQSIEALLSFNHWKLLHIAGLTFPLSNLLLPLSNFLVHKNERSKLSLSSQDRTKLSGRRKVKFKTYFPSIFGFLLNETSLFPIYLLQKLFVKSERALVLYFEAKPISAPESVENDRNS